MTYALVYSSKTGNTKLLAQTVERDLAEETLLYVGPPSEKALQADRIFVGFWTDRGRCDQDTAAFLKTLRKKQVFLFGTAGFGESETYFAKILKRTKRLLPWSSKLLDSFMCCGKMPLSVRQRYEKLKESPHPPAQIDRLIENFDRVIFHPDAADLLALQDKVLRCIASK